MSIDTNIQAGADEMAKQLDKCKTVAQAEVVADRLRADFIDCMSQGEEGKERWGKIASAMQFNSNDHDGVGYDVQVKYNNGLPELTLVNGEGGIVNPFSGKRHFTETLSVNEDHSSRKGLTPHAESGAAPRSVLPIEMR
ncbi:MAG: hypothetical protein IT343_08200 [Candidatus Melainabacteria bacterium]|jgi:hypothetical protein|nr:hypothetical protein [Candidatus Melainabacteria bacterium]